SGTLAIGAGGSLAASSPVNLTGAGARFNIGGATTPQSIGTLSGVAGSTIDLGANNLTLAGSGSGVFAGDIGGAGGLTLAGTGSQALTGNNTYAGGTALTGGSLVVGSGTALGLGALDVNGSASLGASVPGVTLGNAVNLGTGVTLGLNGANDLGLSGT
ncbi:hypothetical protein, partial [Burkholderia cenocepacia]